MQASSWCREQSGAVPVERRFSEAFHVVAVDPCGEGGHVAHAPLGVGLEVVEEDFLVPRKPLDVRPFPSEALLSRGCLLMEFS